jgi:nucleoside-triphosphatase THEP1
MKIKHHEIEIPEENPFENCELEREPFAKVLTNIVDNYAEGFVLAINNEWGTGKTTFVKMWQQHLKNEGFQTIYFNAWENDFDNNPLVALMSELETLTNSKNKKVFKSVVEKGAVLVKNIAPALAKSLIKKYVVDIDDISLEAINNITKASTEILEGQIKDYTNKKKTINEFKKELEKFVKQADNSKPLIFIVDELDRCRPNYSVEVLEQIKHFFSVPGIVFVLSIDKKHLSSAVKGFYGSEQIDSNEYLRRFIDLEYSIPAPKVELFNQYLYGYYGFDEFFISEERRTIPEFREDRHFLLKISEVLFTKWNTTLRQQERIFALSRLVLASFSGRSYTFPSLLFILVYLKTMKLDLFQQIERNELTLQELSDAFIKIVQPLNKHLSGLSLVYIQAQLLWFYNNNKDYQDKVKLIEKNEKGELTTPIECIMVLDNGAARLEHCFEGIQNQWNYSNSDLNYLINKINLREPITV